MDLPVCSPGPMEDMWGIVVRQVYADNKQFRSVEEQKRAVVTAWDNISDDVIASFGDSGGGVFQCTNGRRCEIMGVVSEGSSCEENYKYRNETEKNRKIDPQSQEDLFTDVRKYVEWICEATGVVPIELLADDGVVLVVFDGAAGEGVTVAGLDPLGPVAVLDGLVAFATVVVDGIVVVVVCGEVVVVVVVVEVVCCRLTAVL
ncbi:unnamed protein product [Nippostrongylus brasiliensis]|uniref:Peptidase S1 domain-containing protein n=1 Tax=Nippostrongylus brasiliensis TaxID=27835 RepID=A0A0N4YK16_NIPBR|nr:unnamed protein product [Nippostrongylus brasiliensis]